MNCAKYKDMIQVNYIANGSNNSGGLTGNWSVYFSEWGNIKPLNQGRALYYGIVENVQSYAIEMRLIEGKEITPQMTLTVENKTLTIHSVIELNDAEDRIKIIAYAR